MKEENIFKKYWIEHLGRFNVPPPPKLLCFPTAMHDDVRPKGLKRRLMATVWSRLC